MRIFSLGFLVFFGLLLFNCQADFSTTEAFDRGHEVYLAHCVSCHGMDGDGNKGVYPALANRVMNEHANQRSIDIITKGSPLMKPIQLEAVELVDVVNYIQNNWGLKQEYLTIQDLELVGNL